MTVFLLFSAVLSGASAEAKCRALPAQAPPRLPWLIGLLCLVDLVGGFGLGMWLL